MKLKIYDRSLGPLKVGVATLNVNKGGMFGFSARSADVIGLEHGSKVLIIQDEDRPKDWYVAKDHRGGEPTGFEVRGKKANTLCFNSSYTAQKIKDSLGLNGSVKSMRFLIGTAPVKHDGLELWPIITKSVNAKEE